MLKAVETKDGWVLQDTDTSKVHTEDNLSTHYPALVFLRAVLNRSKVRRYVDKNLNVHNADSNMPTYPLDTNNFSLRDCRICKTLGDDIRCPWYPCESSYKYDCEDSCKTCDLLSCRIKTE